MVTGATLLFWGTGFTSLGVAANSIAAMIQSAIGNVAAGSIFALCQSIGATSPKLGSSYGVLIGISSIMIGIGAHAMKLFPFVKDGVSRFYDAMPGMETTSPYVKRWTDGFIRCYDSIPDLKNITPNTEPLKDGVNKCYDAIPDLETVTSYSEPLKDGVNKCYDSIPELKTITPNIEPLKKVVPNLGKTSAYVTEKYKSLWAKVYPEDEEKRED